MGLVNNCFRYYFGNTAEGSAHALLPGQWNSYRQFEKFIMPEMASAVLQTVANPPGGYIPGVYQPPILVGEMAMRSDSSGTLTGNLLPTKVMTVDMTGSGDLAATAALAIAMQLAMTGSGSMTAEIEGRLNMTVDMAGSGDMAADMEGIANMAVAMLGEGDLEAAILAYGNMSIDITVTGTGLSTANVGQAVWAALAAANNEPGTMGEKLNDAGSAANPWTEVIESGLTAAEIMRIITAALAGKRVGLGTATEEYMGRDGVTPRITFTPTDAEGNGDTTVDGS